MSKNKNPNKLRWSMWVPFLDGWISRFSIFIPLVGYLILFSDAIADKWEFSTLIGPTTETDFGLTSSQRLRFMYFGLLLLGLSYFIYRIRKPTIFRYGTNLVDYTKTALETFTFLDFEKIQENIYKDSSGRRFATKESSDPEHFLYHDWEWGKFSQSAVGYGDNSSKTNDGNWDAARRMHGGLLRIILRETFFQKDRQYEYSRAIRTPIPRESGH